MKFSITIPAYKSKYLFEAIESCLAQTYQDFEVIIVDDASPENLKTVVNQFHDGRIRYFRNEKNCGALNVVDNWNICLSYATGDYIICMGDDDRLLPNCLEVYASLMEKYPNLAIYHGLTEIIDENGNVSNIQEARPEREGVFSMINGRLRNHRTQYIGDWVMSREKLNQMQGYVNMPYAWGSDDLTAFKLALYDGVANTQIPVFQYRVSSLTISNSGHFREKARTQMNVFGELEKLLTLHLSFDDGKEETFRMSTLKIMPEIKRVSIQNYIMSDLRSTGLVSGLYWWLKNIHQYGFSRKEVIKTWGKSLRF